MTDIILTMNNKMEEPIPEMWIEKNGKTIEVRRPTIELYTEEWEKLIEIAKIVTNEKKPSLSKTITEILKWFIEQELEEDFLKYWFEKLKSRIQK